MKMRGFAAVVTIIIFLGVFGAPKAHAALTEAQIQAILGLLQSFGADQSVINNVNSSLRGGVAVAPSGTVQIALFTENLGWGSTHPEVSKLQQFLKERGYFTGEVTGSFFGATAQAVKTFQSKYQIEQSGYFGPQTRAVANNILQGGQTQPSITVLSPNGGEVWEIGSTNRIEWKNSNLPSGSDPINIQLVNEQGVLITTIAQGVATGGVSTGVGGGAYMWTIPSSMSSGTYRIRVICTKELADCFSGSLPVSDTSDAPFSIVAPTTTTLPSAGSLSVSLDSATSFGFRNVLIGSTGVSLASLRFTAVGEDIDVKQIALQLSDTALNTPDDLLNREIQLYDGNAVLIGRAVFTTGDYAISTNIINFRVPGGGSKVMFIKGDIAANATIGDTLKVDYDGNNAGLGGNYGVGWTSGNTIIPTGSDTASAGVKIISPTSATQPSITVLSPNGGIAQLSGGAFDIKYRTSGVSRIGLVLIKNGVTVSSVGMFDQLADGEHSVAFLVGPHNEQTIGTGSGYKVKIYNWDNASTVDESDALFSIVKPSLTASLDAGSPAGSILAGTSRVSLMRVKLSAGGSDVKINGVTIQDNGAGGRISNLELTTPTQQDAETHLANGVAMGGGRYQFSAPITIPANGSKLLDIRVNVSPTASGGVWLTFESVLHGYGNSLVVSGLGFQGSILNITGTSSIVPNARNFANIFQWWPLTMAPR